MSRLLFSAFGSVLMFVSMVACYISNSEGETWLHRNRWFTWWIFFMGALIAPMGV